MQATFCELHTYFFVLGCVEMRNTDEECIGPLKKNAGLKITGVSRFGGVECSRKTCKKKSFSGRCNEIILGWFAHTGQFQHLIISAYLLRWLSKKT